MGWGEFGTQAADLGMQPMTDCCEVQPNADEEAGCVSRLSGSFVVIGGYCVGVTDVICINCCVPWFTVCVHSLLHTCKVKKHSLGPIVQAVMQS